jgi:hypothetical protein
MTEVSVFGGLGRMVIGSNALPASVRSVGPTVDSENVNGVTVENAGDVGPETDADAAPDDGLEEV